jgi:hypothetical protein
MDFGDRFRKLGKMARPPKGPGRYEFEPVSWKVSRRLKGVKGPAEDREGIRAFVENHSGVEAYVEPKTVMHPLSVVLVAGDGEHKRFELSDDAYLRELVGTHNLRVFDAARVGYPPRMREFLRRQPSKEDR